MLRQRDVWGQWEGKWERGSGVGVWEEFSVGGSCDVTWKITPALVEPEGGRREGERLDQ